MDLQCKKCLITRSDDKLGDPCKTPGCDGIIEELPAFDTLVDDLPERFTCGRRAESGRDDPNSPFKHSGKNLDYWQMFKSNGDRTCSYCGSLHFDDFTRLVKASAEAPDDAEYGSVVEIEPSDKSYKVYVNQPGVRNAMEGGIKFYMQHVPRGPDGKIAVTDQQNAEYNAAVRRSKARFERHLYGARNK